MSESSAQGSKDTTTASIVKKSDQGPFSVVIGRICWSLMGDGVGKECRISAADAYRKSQENMGR